MPQSDKTAMGLALEGAGVKNAAPPPNPTQKIFEMRNGGNISLAIKYTREELDRHLLETTTESKGLLIQAAQDLLKRLSIGSTDTLLVAAINKLIGTMDELEQATADLLAGAQAQIAEFTQEFEELQSGSQNIASPITPSMVDAELERRGKRSNEIGAVQEKLEDEKADIESELTILRQRILEGDTSELAKSKRRELEKKLLALTTTISSIIEAIRENNEKVGKLVAYKNAEELIKRGLPQGIIGEKLFDFMR